VTTDFDLAPIAPATEAPPDQMPPPTTTTNGTSTTQAPSQATVNHTPGGIPAIPATIIVSNTTVASLSALAVVGGPIAAAAAAGTVMVGAVAMKAAGSRRSTRTKHRSARGATGGNRSGSGGGRSTGSGRSGSTHGGSGRSGRGSTGAGASPRRTSPTTSRLNSGGSETGKRTGSGNGRLDLKKSSRSGGGFDTSRGTPRTTSGTGGGSRTGAGKKDSAGKSRARQIKDLRKDKKNGPPTRKDQRVKDLADRRGLRDARRDAKRDAKAAVKENKKTGKNTGQHKNGGHDTGTKALKNGTAGKTSTLGKLKPSTSNGKLPGRTEQGKPKGAAAATLKKPMAKASRRERLRTWARGKRDQLAKTRAERISRARRGARARWQYARRRASAELRFAARAVPAALLAAPIGLLGCITTPIGRRLGWKQLMYPGRRFYWRLTRRARHDYAARVEDAKNTLAYDTDPASIDTAPVADTVPRAPRTSGPALTPGEPAMSEALKFLFEESAADMEAAAQAYEPGGMIHVYQTIQGMPAGIQSWANTFKILAEKSDDSFPLEKAVGEALSDVFDLLRKAASAAEDVREVFEKVHEHDLERLNSPRKSLEAEKTWDAAANEDYLDG
jgi:hypothetical protein